MFAFSLFVCVCFLWCVFFLVRPLSLSLPSLALAAEHDELLHAGSETPRHQPALCGDVQSLHFLLALRDLRSQRHRFKVQPSGSMGKAIENTSVTPQREPLLEASVCFRRVREHARDPRSCCGRQLQFVHVLRRSVLGS